MDIMNGKCVRLRNGDFLNRTDYNGDPFQIAASFADAGMRRLHMVDLDGARDGRSRNIELLVRISNSLDMEIDFGGGIRTREDLLQVFECGATMVSVGSIMLTDEKLFETWVGEFGPEKFFPGIDVMDGMVYIKGWQENSGVRIETVVNNCIRIGIGRVFCTDISRDGMMKGPSIGFYRELVAQFPQLKIIASGGVGSLSHVEQLESAGCDAVIVGRALYEGGISLDEVKRRNAIC